MLLRHDRMERDVFQRLGAPVPTTGLVATFDLALASQPGLDAVAAAAAARSIARFIADHADAPTHDIFPWFVSPHDEQLAKRLVHRYCLITLLYSQQHDARHQIC